MIGYLSGTVRTVRKNYLILSGDSVGYKVFVTPQVLLGTETGKPLSLFIHTHVREDQISLFGFFSLAELDFFELLLGVSGVGPKTALAVLSLSDLDVVKSGIMNGDSSVLMKVSGIGKKTGERIILELREKIGETVEDRAVIEKLSKEHADVLDVLLALGYSKHEARKAIAEIPKELSETQDKVREALRSLAKQ